ncbi:MAG: hypothetical protein AAGA62_06135 [Bacteroidota bacterium]
MKNRMLRILPVIITFVWTGMVLGVSFLEAPLKFQAPDITLRLGLGIGRLVFGVLNKIEIVFAVTLAVSLVVGKVSWRANFPYPLVFMVLLVQTAWLLPVMDARAELILAGQEVPSTYHHLLYIILEVSKVLLLLVGGVTWLRRTEP